MKDKKHPHHDLIVEWAKDTSKTIQGRLNGDWAECFIGNVTNDRAGSYEYRFKPREFTKGHWYPCLNGESMSVNMWDGEEFLSESGDGDGYIFDETDFDEIGESLGVIDFPG